MKHLKALGMLSLLFSSLLFSSLLFSSLLCCKINNIKPDEPFVDDFDISQYAVDNPTQNIFLDDTWTFANFSEIHSGSAVLYKAVANPKSIVVAVNAGHGTTGGSSKYTYSHPDKSSKITGGTNPQGAVMSTAVSTGTELLCGLSEAQVNYRVAVVLRKYLLEAGYDVLMLRDGDDVQLDNVARTVISNNVANIHISIHFDSDTYNYDKGCFYCSIPKELKTLDNVKLHYNDSEALGETLVQALVSQGIKKFSKGKISMDLTQTSYSFIPTVDIELGNQCTRPTTAKLEQYARGLLEGIKNFHSSVIDCPEEIAAQAFEYAKKYAAADTEYGYGAQDPLRTIRIDCSGLIIMCYTYALEGTGYKLIEPDMASAYMYENAATFTTTPRRGDLIFMGNLGPNGTAPTKVSHIAIFDRFEGDQVYFIDSTEQGSISGVSERHYAKTNKKIIAYGIMKLKS